MNIGKNKFCNAATLLFLASFCFGQTNDEGLAFLQFNFLNPGARALAMGGAFVGLADDATAVLANPAGITILTKPEASVEFSVTNYRNPIPWDQGSLNFTYTQTGNVVRMADFVPSYNPADFPRTIQNFSFASFVYPLIQEKFVLSGFYNEQTKFERQTHLNPGGFSLCVASDPSCTLSPLGSNINFHIFNPTDNSVELEIKNLGMSVGLQPTKFLSLGFTLSYSTLQIDSITERKDMTAPQEPLFNRFLLSADDSQLSYTAGVKIRPVHSLTFGAVYNRRPEFDATASNKISGNAISLVGVPVTYTFSAKFNVPDSFAIGMSLQPHDRFLMNFDAVRVQYSELMDGYYNARFNPLQTDYYRRTGNPDISTTREFQESTLEVEDGTEYRVGAEYVAILTNKYILALRGGYWKEPFHSVIQTVNDPDLIWSFTMQPFGVLGETSVFPFWLRSLKDQFNGNHITAGIGLVLQKQTIDLGFDYSRDVKRFVVSSITHF